MAKIRPPAGGNHPKARRGLSFGSCEDAWAHRWACARSRMCAAAARRNELNGGGIRPARPAGLDGRPRRGALVRADSRPRRLPRVSERRENRIRPADSSSSPSATRTSASRAGGIPTPRPESLSADGVRQKGIDYREHEFVGDISTVENPSPPRVGDVGASSRPTRGGTPTRVEPWDWVRRRDRIPWASIGTSSLELALRRLGTGTSTGTPGWRNDPQRYGEEGRGSFARVGRTSDLSTFHFIAGPWRWHSVCNNHCGRVHAGSWSVR